MSIGFFDSGVGGLSILRHVISEMPSTDFTYIADSANCPWGEKDNDFIDNRSVELTEFWRLIGTRSRDFSSFTSSVS